MLKNLFKKKPVRSVWRRDPSGELRQDFITGQWVLIAKGRSKRPHDAGVSRHQVGSLPHFKKGCPFCELDRFPQAPDVIRLPDDQHRWQVHIFENKYPALKPKGELNSWQVGPYRTVSSVGYHEVLAMRAHNQMEARLTQQEFAWQIEALVTRFRQLRVKPYVNYIQIIKNHGPESGQSLEHPHLQIFTVPVLPNDIQSMLRGAQEYGRRHGENGYEVMMAYEREQRVRIVWENEHFTAFCPYASRMPYEVWIMPRQVDPFFENSSPAQQMALAQMMQQVLRRLSLHLNNPAYNYYIHSAPCDETGFVCDREQFKHFSWHIEILPRLGHLGGFELGTGLEINSVMPEEAAAALREVDITITE